MNPNATHLNTRQTSETIGIPQATLRWWRHRGEGPKSFKLGRTVFYDVRDLSAWVEQQKRATEKGGE
jgi:predicted DNA-binding transcriptional regulator AlpA